MRLSWFAFVGLLACNTDVGKHIAPPPASTPPTPLPVAPKSTRPMASAAATPDGGASDPRRDGPPDCRFERPAVWTSGRLSWLGRCHNGFAQGSGVLVQQFDESLRLEPSRFYGSLQNGYLSVGVLEVPGGSMAGNWVHGDLAPPLDDDMAERNVAINAFDVAAAAATAVSKSFAENGDTESSRFYADRARRFSNAMD